MADRPDRPDPSDRPDRDDAEQRPAGIRDKIAGFGVTFTTMFTRVVTEATADQRAYVAARGGPAAAEGDAQSDRAGGHTDGKPSVEGSVAR